MQAILAVGCGGFVGATMRYLCTAGIGKLYTGAFPFPTFCVNLIGSFLIGFLSQWLMLSYPDSKTLKFFLMTGILGGFTTFSTFSLETAELFQKGSAGLAVLNIVGSAVCCVLGAIAGKALANAVS